MRFRRKRSACIGLSLLLAIGSISFPGYAREQEAQETSIEAPADEAAAQAAGKELMDGEVTQETSGMEDAGEMMEPAGQDGTEERSVDEAIADTPYDTPEESADAVDEPVEEEAVNTAPDSPGGEQRTTGEDAPGSEMDGQAADEEPAEDTAPVEVSGSAGEPDTGSSPSVPEAGETIMTISYDDNAPMNGKYFAHDRTMTVSITAPEFDESLLSLEIRVNGEGGSRTLNEVRQGSVPGTALVQEPVTEDGTTVLGILFGGQGEEVENRYAVRASYNGVDADTGDSAAPEEFVVDEVSPVIGVAFTDAEGAAVTPLADKDTPCFVEGAVTAMLSVTEKNFSPEGADVTVTAQDPEGKDTGAYAESSVDAVRTSEWDRNGSTWTFSMDAFEKDANYTFAMEYEDLAGNRAAAYGPCFFTVDTEAPTGEIIIKTGDGEGKEYAKVLEEKDLKELEEGKLEYAFGMAGRSVTLESTARDSAAGVEKVQYCLIDIDGTAQGTFTIKTQMEELRWEEYREEIKIEDDRLFIVYVRITDRAGHVTYLSSSGGIIADTKKPSIPKIMVSGPDKDIYNRDIKLSVSAEDMDGEGEGLFSGIKELSYEVVNNETGEVTLEGKKEEKSFRVRAAEDSIRIQAAENESNSVSLKVAASDHAGNVSDKTIMLSFDTIDPEIGITFDDSGVRNGHYFNSARKVTVTFKERNFSAAQSKLMVRCGNEDVVLSMEQLSEGRGAAFGISIKDVKDSQGELPWEERTDERMVTYTLLIGGGEGTDRDYRNLRFTCTDTAGNAAEKAEGKYAYFTVDRTAPVVAVSYKAGKNSVTGKIGTNSSAPYYTQDPVTVTITVQERNFVVGGAEASVTQKDFGGRDVSAYSGESVSAVSGEGWAGGAGGYTFTMDSFSADANYGLGIQVTDLAGNTAVYGTHYFTVDSTPPTGSIIVTSGDGSGTYTGYSGSVSFRFMDSSPVAVANRAEDKTSGVASVSYYRYVPGAFERGVFKGLTLEKLRKAAWKEWGRDLSITPDSQAVVYARIIDRAGNITYMNTEGAVIADSTEPSAPEIAINAAASAGGIYNRSVPVSVSVEDILSGGTFSGLKSVTAEVVSAGKVTQRYERSFGPKEERRKTYAEDFTVDAAKNNSNNVMVRITAQDYAGNVSGMEKSMKIDITAPRIEVAYDGGGITNGAYYNRTRTATVTVYERNFDPSGVSFHISGPARISGWETGNGAGLTDDNVNRCTVTFSEDAEYAFSLGVTDMAGNHAEYGRTDRFTVDRTAPVISVSFDNNSGRGRYYNAPRTAAITVIDGSFDGDLFEAAISASLDGYGINAPRVSGWSHSGDRHYASVSFDGDGDYSFTLDVTDLAGNRAATYRQELFTIDMTKPAVSFFGVENGSANRGEAAPGAEYSDLNIGDNVVRLVLSGYRHPEREVTGEMETLEHGGRVRLADFAHVITEDDVYTLTASVTDLAGNETEEKLVFSVNRFGSNYYFSDMTADYLAEYYHQKGSSIVIFEVNADDLHDNKVTIYHDGRAVMLSEGSFKIDDISEKDDWKRYRYSMDGSLFTEEGVYEIFVSSVDEAGNLQDNKLRGVPVGFAIDRTPPGAVITGVEDGKLYEEESREITVVASDNMAMGTLRILINGEEKASFDAEEIAEAEGKLPYTLTESGSWQEITLAFEDAAGNRGTADSCRVLLTTDWAARILHRKGIWLPILIILAAGIWILAAWRRKKREEH